MDTIVNPEQQVILQKKLSAAGVVNQFVCYEKEAHGWESECMDDSFNKIKGFFNEYVH